MKSAAEVKRRIKSVTNTAQITKAMEVVSATKMRRSQQTALNARPYAFSAFELLASALRKQKGVAEPKLFAKSKGKKTLLVVVTSDKGLAGSLNANVLRKAQPLVTGTDVEVVAVGKKAHGFFTHRKLKVVKEFFGHGDYADYAEVKDITAYLTEQFLTGEYKQVVVAYTNFVSTLKQEAVVRQVLPLSQNGLKEMIEGITPVAGRFSDAKSYSLQAHSYLFEPSPETVMNGLVDRLFQMQIYHIILEANASEHSARMVAMKTASENAEEIADGLNLLFNKQRQAKITQELVEITSGSDAVN